MWIDNALKNRYIQSYPYSDFENVKYSEEGTFSRVASADWPKTSRKVALKRLKHYDVDKFILEIQMHTMSHSSKNVTRFLGLTKEEEPGTSYIMIFEYADRNNLREFLKSTTSLEWIDKVNLSLEIARGLKYLHSLKIAHRDLNSNNIVVFQLHSCQEPLFIAKIADFGSATMMNDYDRYPEDTNRVLGQIPFTDPKYLNDHKYYKKDLRSDIYSLGVTLWEISSGRAPFENFMPESYGEFRDLCLTFEIISDLRERRILLTPDRFVRIYKDCWKDEPDERPIIDEVIERLNTTAEFVLSQAQNVTGNVTGE